MEYLNKQWQVGLCLYAKKPENFNIEKTDSHVRNFLMIAYWFIQLGSPVRIASQDAQIDVPSSASIEGLRASLTDLVSEFRAVNQLKSDDKGQKLVVEAEKQAARSPLVPLNIYGHN